MNATRRLAGSAGILYLLLGIFAGFAEGYVEPKMYVAGDAAATTANVVANSGLVRMGAMADVLGAMSFIFLALALYSLLQRVNKNAARALLVLVTVAVAITCLNAVFEFEGLRVATGAVDLASVSPAGSNTLVLLLLDAQHNGLLIAQIFFGLWMVPLGYLAYQSGWFPKTLAILLVVGGVCYVINTLTAFLIPSLDRAIDTFITIPSAIAEVWMVVYLLLIGLGVRKIAPES